MSDLRQISDRLAETCSPDEVWTWLCSRQALLDGGRAIDLIYEGRGDEVMAALDGLRADAA